MQTVTKMALCALVAFVAGAITIAICELMGIKAPHEKFITTLVFIVIFFNQFRSEFPVRKRKNQGFIQTLAAPRVMRKKSKKK